VIEKLLALALVLSVATKLRFGNLPIGPSEILMLFLSVIITKRAINKIGYLKLMHTITPVVIFWSIISVSLALGAILGVYKGLPSGGAGIHSAIALGYAGFISVVLYVQFIIFPDSTRKVMLMLIWIAVPLLGFAYIVEFVVIKQLGADEAWYDYFLLQSYFGARFSGWSKNPNQLALLFSILPFIVLRLNNKIYTTHILLLITIITWMGWHIRSDAMSSAWEFAAVLLTLICFVKLLQKQKITNLWIFPIVLLVTGIIFHNMSDKIFKIPGVTTTLISGVSIDSNGTYYISALNEEDSIISDEMGDETIFKEKILANISNIRIASSEKKINVRIALLKNSIEAWKLSPIFGLGPGAHSGLEGPFGGKESHNSFMDLLTNTGIVGVIAFLVLMAWVAYGTFRLGDIYGFLGLIVLTIFATGHLMIRHPIFWFLVISLLTEITLKMNISVIEEIGQKNK